MPNQDNFRTDLTTQVEPRFTVSRIINVPDDIILNEEVPASFAFDKDDNIELHFYTAQTNQLILSSVITPDENIIKSHIVAYNDGTYKNYIRIDFTSLFVEKQIILVPGEYRMVVNFFSDEIGSYEDRRLSINVISDTRTEVQVSFNNTINDVVLQENLYLLNEFVEKGFNKSDAIGTAEKIFVSGVNPRTQNEDVPVEIIDSTEGLTAENIKQNIETETANQIIENTLNRIQKIGAQEIFDTQLNSFLPELYKFVREEIVINGDERIQKNEFRELMEAAIRNNINRFAQIVDKRIQVS
jgi:hypothetical protein